MYCNARDVEKEFSARDAIAALVRGAKEEDAICRSLDGGAVVVVAMGICNRLLVEKVNSRCMGRPWLHTAFTTIPPRLCAMNIIGRNLSVWIVSSIPRARKAEIHGWATPHLSPLPN
jgi:hypothetical protein